MYIFTSHSYDWDHQNDDPNHMNAMWKFKFLQVRFLRNYNHHDYIAMGKLTHYWSFLGDIPPRKPRLCGALIFPFLTALPSCCKTVELLVFWNALPRTWRHSHNELSPWDTTMSILYILNTNMYTMSKPSYSLTSRGSALHIWCISLKRL